MPNPRQLLEVHGLRPKKQLGQNFLHDPNSLQKIIDIAQVSSADTVLEIGAGTGSLTRHLAAHAGRVLALEVDERLAPVLQDELADFPNVKVIWQDILEADLDELLGTAPFKVVANLPYYITSAILRKMLEAPHKPLSMTIMVQKQVADRLVAKPDDMSILSVSVQFYGHPKIMTTLKPAVFYPRPEVDSSVVHIEVYSQPIVEVPDEKTFFNVVRAGFGQKRKQLKNSLAAGLHLSSEDAVGLLEKAEINGMRRAETLTLEEWARLSRIYKAV